MADDARYVGVNDHGNPVGEYHPRAKLTDEDVELIRQLRESDPPMPMREIAAKFEVSVGTVHDVVSYRRRATSYVGWRKVRIGKGVATGEKAND